MEKPTAIVIGAGLGGIAAAARLARHGYQVTVIEKNEHAGGRCDHLLVDGHHFDTGPTLFLMPEIYAQTFTDLGERMEDHLDLRPIDPTYRLHFHDGSSLLLTSDLNVMRSQLETMEPGAFRGFLRYITEAQLHFKLTLKHIVGRNFLNPFDFFNLKNLLLLFKLKTLTKHVDYVARYFKDPRLQLAFTFQDMYLGISHYEAPATYSFLQYTELADGVWFPSGGMYRIISALVSIAGKHGVRFFYNTPVEKINILGQRATGVILADGRVMPADILVANADLPYVYRSLLPDDGSYAGLARKQYSFSTVTFFWGLKKQYPQFAPHNLFLTGDMRRGFDQIFKDLNLPDQPSFYVHAPAHIDHSLAPEGQDSLIVIIPVGHLNEASPQDWVAIRQKARQSVLKRFAEMGISDLEEHIKFEVDFTPENWLSRYNLTRGSPHGLSYNLRQVGYLRPHNRHKRYRNLYFVGASTHPGTGLPMVLISARLTTERILQDAGTPQTAFHHAQKSSQRSKG